MKKNPTPNKAEKFDEEVRARQEDHKDKERRKFTSSIYDKKTLPKQRGQTRRGK